MDMQKSNKELKSALQNQLSLTQQHLLGVQSMLTCSRLWVISHDHIQLRRKLAEELGLLSIRLHSVKPLLLLNVFTMLLQLQRPGSCFKEKWKWPFNVSIRTLLPSWELPWKAILMELMNTSGHEEDRVKDHQTCGILQDVAKALYFLHTRPGTVIHHDVSSANVLLKILYNDEWLAKLGELGTAKM